MENGKLLHEAQLIASEFKFYMVKGNLRHLYGYIYESPNKETKYPLEIKYTKDFPTYPPDFIFPLPIPNVPEEIELNALNNWTPESHVVTAVRELAVLIKNYVEQQEEEKEIYISTEEPSVQPTYAEFSTEELSSQSYKQEKDEEEQYLTPDMSQYLYEQEEYINPDEILEWNSEEEVPENESIYPTLDPSADPYNVPALTPTERPIYPSIEAQNLDAELDVKVSTEAALIQQEYAIDYVGNTMGVVEVYLTITLEQTFIIRIDFSSFPKKPEVVVQDNLRKILGDVDESIGILKSWDENNPRHVVELIREVEGKLWFLSDIEQEAKMIFGEYKTEMVDGLISHLQVGLFTYGFKEYILTLDISKYPNEPLVQFSSALQEVLPFSPQDLMVLKNWKRKESHVVDVLREISWLVDKASRISFEVDLLKGGVKKVDYDKTTDKFSIEISGQLKTKDLAFTFEVQMNDEYPITVPHFKLLSALEEYEEIKEKINNQIQSFTQQWHPFNYLIDLFNQISQTIFAESILSCVICHKIDCPECGLKISSSTGDSHDQCQTQCPSCERLYHEHCWNQTIISFGKCGFCLRPPPQHMRPSM
ncbi:MAG: hypothetical protein JW776_10335 [Candidatus Lokiarchaeota archaeon]|nr:hypothetical protein [Candidatus Lokiarchaeota archaeon]